MTIWGGYYFKICMFFKRKCILDILDGENVNINGYKRHIQKNEEWKKLQNLGNPHNSTLQISILFFLWGCLEQAEEPGLIPVFPLSSTFLVYLTSSNTLLSEITSTSACPKNPQVAKEYSQSSKSVYPTTASAWLGCTLELWLCPQYCKELQRKGSFFLRGLWPSPPFHHCKTHAETMISTTGTGQLPDYSWFAVTDTASLLEGPGVEQGQHHTSSARVKDSKTLPSQTYLQHCPETAEILHLARY